MSHLIAMSFPCNIPIKQLFVLVGYVEAFVCGFVGWKMRHRLWECCRRTGFLFVTIMGPFNHVIDVINYVGLAIEGIRPSADMLLN